MKAKIKPQGYLGIIADGLFSPIMWALVLFKQRPQRTHFWNNKKLDPSLVKLIDVNMCVQYSGDLTKNKRGLIRFHLPKIFGGWTDYVVVGPTESCDWHIGWTDGNNYIGYSQIVEKKGRPVKVLIGSDPVIFFALNALGEQISLNKKGDGNLCNSSIFHNIPLR